MAARQSKRGEVTFVLGRLPLATKVYLAGSFNNWSPTARMMRRMRDGSFQTQVRLPPGEHQYKFVADGVWMDDPEAPARVPDPYGGTNGLVRVS